MLINDKLAIAESDNNIVIRYILPFQYIKELRDGGVIDSIGTLLSFTL